MNSLARAILVDEAFTALSKAPPHVRAAAEKELTEVSRLDFDEFTMMEQRAYAALSIVREYAPQLVRAHTYRTARAIKRRAIFIRGEFTDWLEKELVRQAGWSMPDNHVCFEFEVAGVNIAVQFTDHAAIFGAKVEVRAW